jgi:hypothetical protein
MLMAKRKKGVPAAVRNGAQRVEVYNEGLVIFLYDEARTEPERRPGRSGRREQAPESQTGTATMNRFS